MRTPDLRKAKTDHLPTNFFPIAQNIFIQWSDENLFKQTLYKTHPWLSLHQGHLWNFIKEGLKTKAQGSPDRGSGEPKRWFWSPSTAAQPEEPSQLVPCGSGTCAQRSGGLRDTAVLSPSEGRGWPWGHVPHLWDSPPFQPRGSPAGTSESWLAPLFTIYSQSEHEATAGSLESPAPAPGAPSLALAFSIFLSFPLSLGSSQRE